jgi:aspartyl protease family protein
VTDQTASMIWYVLALTLVGSALLNRNLSLRSGLGMMMLWGGIFLGFATLYAHRAEFFAMIDKATLGEATHKSEVATPVTVIPPPASGSTAIIRIPVAADGHYWVDGQINGFGAHFLIDSGATITALSQGLAKQAGLNIDATAPGVSMRTANGSIMAQRSNVPRLSVGPIQMNDLGVVVSESFGDTNILGMNFLSQLKRWRVENGEMLLEK